MIFPAIIIALLLCAETETGRNPISECEKWACFASQRCVGGDITKLHAFGTFLPIDDDCASIILIKPYSKTKWEIVIGSRQTTTNEVKVLQNDADLFSCKYDGTNSVPTFEMDITKLEPLSSFPNACHFILGDGSAEIIKELQQQIKVIHGDSQLVESAILDKSFINSVDGKMMCDQSLVQFDQSTDSTEIAKAADVQFDSVSCSDSELKLQYKSDSGYKEVSSFSCIKEGDKYKYKIMPGDILQDGSFHARCAVKVCTLCTTMPTTPSGKTPPKLDDAADGCKTLTCPNFFKIDKEYTAKDVKRECVKSGDEYKWKIDETVVKTETNVECVDKIPCKNIAGDCAGECITEEKTIPKCEANHTLSLEIGDKTHASVSVGCEISNGNGKLAYKAGKEKIAVSGTPTFECKKVKVEVANAKVASAGFRKMTALHVCLSIAVVLTLPIVGFSAFVTIKKRMKDKQGTEGEPRKPRKNEQR